MCELFRLLRRLTSIATFGALGHAAREATLTDHANSSVASAHGETSAYGVFAPGQATTVPLKQIAIGEDAKAARSAFERLMRAPAPLVEAA